MKNLNNDANQMTGNGNTLPVNRVWKTDLNTMNLSRTHHTSAGNASNCMAMGGNTMKTTMSTESLTNGVWSVGSSMNTERYGHSAVGNISNCMVMGGITDDNCGISFTEKYDGMAWYTGINMNIERNSHSAAGNVNDAMVMGGETGSTTVGTIEIYNGSIWSIGARMNCERDTHSAVGRTNDSMVIGGCNDNGIAPNEAYNGATWAIRVSMNIPRQAHGSTGTTMHCMVVGGNNDMFLNNTEIYHGNVWSNAAILNTARATHSCSGNTTNSIAIGGLGEKSMMNTTETCTMHPNVEYQNMKEDTNMKDTLEEGNSGTVCNCVEANASEPEVDHSYLLFSTTGYGMGSTLRVDLKINLDEKKPYVENDIYRNQSSNLDLQTLVKIDTRKVSISLVKDLATDVLKEIGYINSFYSAVEVKQLSEETFNSMVNDGEYNLILHYTRKD